MPRKSRKSSKRQTPKARARQPADMYRNHGYVPAANGITESAYDLIRSRRISIR